MLNRCSPIPIDQCAALACAWEVMAPKPGNVHRAADFESSTLQDFITSAMAIAPIMGRAATLKIGELVLESIEATALWVANNTNLGLVLLLAPLAKAAAASGGGIDSATVRRCLSELDPRDASLVYQAIRTAKPGGLGAVPQWDVSAEPPKDLLQAMGLAAERDAIARQYANGFEDVFGSVAANLTAQVEAGHSLTTSIVHVHVQTMADIPDSLIGRKCGTETARAASALAQRVLHHPIDSPSYIAALGELDFWLRADGHRRNPGTTADLLGAGLFVALRNGMIKPPWR